MMLHSFKLLKNFLIGSFHLSTEGWLGCVELLILCCRRNTRYIECIWPWPWFIPHPTGHIGLHSNTIHVCHELPPLLLPRWTSSFVGLCWLCSSSSLLVDLVLFYILVPASIVLAVVCADGPYAEHVQASVIVFLSVCCPWFVVRFWLWPQCLLFCLSKRCPRMPSTLLCRLWCAASSFFANVAVNGHTSAPHRRVDKIIASYNLVFTVRLKLSFL